TRSSRNFTTVSLLLADLVHELQKERGLSAGFVGCSGQSFKEDVLKQRMQTDEKLGLFFQNLDINASGEGRWGLSDKFTYLQKELYRLTVVRNAIDTLNDGDYFDFYSNLNAHAIDIIHYLQVFTNDATLAKLGNAFSSLLRLQERAGQERGALNGIFASGKLDAKLFQEISAYVADQKAIFNNYYTIVSNEYQDMLRKKMRHPVVVEVEALRAAAINKSRRNELLNDLQIMIGYGGLIHDFKDYVIRGKDWYAERFSKFSIDAKNIIEQYRNLPGMSQEGIINLSKIETTFDQYQIILNDVIKMKESGHSITEIDELVDIDDKPAINAIKQLRKDVTSQDTSEWWEKATFRIELIKNVSDAIRSDIVYRTRQIIATTKKSASLSLVLSIITIAISFSLGYLLMRRPVEEIVNISTNMRNMQKNRDFDQQLLVGGHDEISDLANSFNEMINERKRAVEQIQILFHAIEQSSSTIIITDTKGNIKYGNPKLSQLTGYSIEEVIGKNPRIFKS
ncbi:MAG: PAS domain S-box protein, partial [Cytophagales bacterium]|nr:PAS domain S-box protein [Cytophagales bacterium]